MFDNDYFDLMDVDDFEEFISIMDGVWADAYKGYLDMAKTCQDPKEAEEWLSIAEKFMNSKQACIEGTLDWAYGQKTES